MYFSGEKGQPYELLTLVVLNFTIQNVWLYPSLTFERARSCQVNFTGTTSSF